jgi:hypothetical protein
MLAIAIRSLSASGAAEDQSPVAKKSLYYDNWFRTGFTAEIIPDVISRTRAQLRSNPAMEMPRLGITLYRFRDQRATDPRDKVFAFLGIVKKEYDIEADYNLTKRDIYTKITRQLLSESSWSCSGYNPQIEK